MANGEALDFFLFAKWYIEGMTEVIRYICKSCQKAYGPLGMHGYSPKDGCGERPVICGSCGEIFVGKFQGGKLAKPECPRCAASLALFDGHCPSCGQAAMVFEDIQMPGFERPVPVTKGESS